MPLRRADGLQDFSQHITHRWSNIPIDTQLLQTKIALEADVVTFQTLVIPRGLELKDIVPHRAVMNMSAVEKSGTYRMVESLKR